jgi:hypothetical protein
MPVEIPDVRLGEPDLRPPVARMVAGSVAVYPVGVHRAVWPAVVAAGVDVGVPSARAEGSSGVVGEVVRGRRDVAVEPLVAPASRAGRVPFVEAAYRRRVRLGIDT